MNWYKICKPPIKSNYHMSDLFTSSRGTQQFASTEVYPSYPIQYRVRTTDHDPLRLLQQINVIVSFVNAE